MKTKVDRQDIYSAREILIQFPWALLQLLMHVQILFSLDEIYISCKMG